MDNSSDRHLETIEERLVSLSAGQARLEADLTALRQDISEIKAERSQISMLVWTLLWTLIGIAIAALLGILIVLWRFLFVSVNP